MFAKFLKYRSKISSLILTNTNSEIPSPPGVSGKTAAKVETVLEKKITKKSILNLKISFEIK